MTDGQYASNSAEVTRDRFAMSQAIENAAIGLRAAREVPGNQRLETDRRIPGAVSQLHQLCDMLLQINSCASEHLDKLLGSPPTDASGNPPQGGIGAPGDCNALCAVIERIREQVARASANADRLVGI